MPTFHARLIHADEHPLAGAIVRVIAWSLHGELKVLVEGETDDQGKFTLGFEFEAEPTLLPRLGVQLLSEDSWRDVGESPSMVTLDSIDFGTLVVSEPPVEPSEPTPEIEQLQQALLDSVNHTKLLDAKLLSLNSQLIMTKDELVQAQTSLIEYEQASPLVDVVQDIGSQLGTAARSIDLAALGMVLGGVSVSLKALASGSGTFEFPSVSKLQQIAGAELSTIDLAFYPGTPQLGTSVVEPDQGPGMPNLLGYTELLARRKLEQLQLAVDVSHKAIAKPESGPSPWGRVVEQSPAPGGTIVPGGRVEILIGKPIDNQAQG
jgi:hypothetical protein